MITADQQEFLRSTLSLGAARAVGLADRFDDGSLVLFGAGLRGRRVLSGLRKAGRSPLAFCDNNTKLHGSVVDGLPVLTPAQAAARHPRATYVVTIWSDRIGHPLGAVRLQMRALGVETVISFTSIYRRLPNEFLPEFFLDRLDAIRGQEDSILRAAELWSDDASVAEYALQLQARVNLDLEMIDHATATPAYFPDLFSISPEEVFVDCGAFDGDSYETFAAATGGRYRHYVGIEPDDANFEKLKNRVATTQRAREAKETLLRIGIAERAMKIRFSASGSAESCISDTGTEEIDCRPLDEILRHENATYIKMDIEGAEMSALSGARQTIQRSRPILAVSAYHRVADLWNIPSLIASMVSEYSFYLRPEKRAGWDLLCYAVPRERLRR